MRSCHPGIICERLEDRIVLDAAAPQVVQDGSDNNQENVLDVVTGEQTPDEPGPHVGNDNVVPQDLSQVFDNDLNVVLVSNALDNIQAISDSTDDATVIVFDEKQDTLDSVTNTLKSLTETTQRDIGGIAILSHGDDGVVSIGSDILSFFNVSDFKPFFEQISSMLTEDAQIQFFGCSVSSDFFGQSMIRAIAGFTGAEVFASTDLTGGPSGDWDLEFASDNTVTMKEILDPDKVSDVNMELAVTFPDDGPATAISMDGIVYFAYDDGIHGTELWRSDGTEGGTWMVRDIQVGKKSSDPDNFVVMDSTLYFAASDGNTDNDLHHGRELWKSKGDAASTEMVLDINDKKKTSSNPDNFVVIGDTLYFTASDGNTDNVLDHGTELWKSEGDAANTEMVKDIMPGKFSSDPTQLTNVNGTLYFAADNGTNGFELWKSDGTDPNTVMVKDIQSGSGSSNPSGLTNVNGTLFFSADNGTNGVELWESDGTDPNTVMVKDILTGSGSSNPEQLTNVNGTLFFSADNGTNGVELWKSDGTDPNTVMVKDILTGSGSSNPEQLTNVGGTLYFSADNGTNGIELWKSDGTDATTVMVEDINAGAGSSTPVSFNEYDGELIFVADDGIHGYEPWKSDGTADGTELLVDIDPSGSSFPISFARVNPLFFLADAGKGYELWKSDGTIEGTVRVSGLNSDSGVGNTTANQSTTPLSDSVAGAESSESKYQELRSMTSEGTGSNRLFTTSGKPDLGAGQPKDTHVTGADNAAASVPVRQASVEPDDGPDREGVSPGDVSDAGYPAHPGTHLVPGMIKVVVLSNGNYSVTADTISVVVTPDVWLPPMVKWYLVSVSEGRYRHGSLPPKYEAMIWDFLKFLDQHKKNDEGPINELKLRLAWQWAEWRKQVLKEHGDRDVLPWSYFHGLSKALTTFYGKSDNGQVSYSSALTALKHNVTNLNIIPVRLPEETMPHP